MEREKIISRFKKGCYLHDGKWHADDILVTCILAFNAIPVYRISRDQIKTLKDNDDIILVDCGEGMFDHHQDSAELRPEGYRRSAFGLIWNFFEDELKLNLLLYLGFKLDKVTINRIFEEIDNQLIRFIDADDNGVTLDTSCQYSWLMAACNSLNVYPENKRDALQCTVIWPLLKSVFIDIANKVISEATIKAAIEAAIRSKHDWIVLEEGMPWQSHVLAWNFEENEHIIKSVVIQKHNGTWNIQQVPVTHGSFDLLKRLPENLQEIAPEGFVFKHVTGFLANYETLETAIAAMQKVYEVKDNE